MSRVRDEQADQDREQVEWRLARDERWCVRNLFRVLPPRPKKPPIYGPHPLRLDGRCHHGVRAVICLCCKDERKGK